MELRKKDKFMLLFIGIAMAVIIIIIIITIANPKPTNSPVLSSFYTSKTTYSPNEKLALYYNFDMSGNKKGVQIECMAPSSKKYSIGNKIDGATSSATYLTNAPLKPGTYTYTGRVVTMQSKTNTSNTLSLKIVVVQNISVEAVNDTPQIDTFTTNRTTASPGDTVILTTTYHNKGTGKADMYYSGANNSTFVNNNDTAILGKNNEYTSQKAIVLPNVNGSYTYQVKVNNGKKDSNIKGVTINVINTNVHPTATEYVKWIDLGGCNGNMFFYFMANKVGTYSLDIYRDGALIQSQNVDATETNAITRFSIFNPGFGFPMYKDKTLAPDGQSRMLFDFYININGSRYLLVSTNEDALLQVGHITYN